MMIKKRIIAATAALLAAFSLTCGCEDPKESEVEENNYESNEKFDEMFKDVPDSEEGPLLTIKDKLLKQAKLRRSPYLSRMRRVSGISADFT